MPEGMHSQLGHALVIPLFGEIAADLPARLHRQAAAGYQLVLVDNRTPAQSHAQPIASLVPGACVVMNHNQGRVAGGFNRGIARAIHNGAHTITLLDQDSHLEVGALETLASTLASAGPNTLVGPKVVDRWRRSRKQANQGRGAERLHMRRMLISAGTTFRSADWPALGEMHEPLEIDFVDHHWCFRARQRGFRCLEDSAVILQQSFGQRHPNGLCHQLGLQLYPPERHYTAVRNLRWLLRLRCVPLDLKVKEVTKMLAKPFCWLVMEPQRHANLQALRRGILDPLPADDPLA